MDEPSRITRGVRAGLETDPAWGAVVPPIYLTSTFAFEGFDQPRKYDYTRAGNPTRDLLATALADLEGGAGAVVTATGTAAMTTIICALLEPGETIVAPHDCYGGTWRLFEALAAKGHFAVEYADLTGELPEADVVARMTGGDDRRPAVVWLETPSNPLLRVIDLPVVVAAAHSLGALVVVDNTFCSPLGQQPLSHGADLVFHSTTKYLNGHSDVVGGAIVAATAELAERMDWWSNTLGVTGSPFDSYLTLRGLRTLHARLRIHEANATELARLLLAHPAVSRVYYPGLPQHPGHAIAARQQSTFGGMVTFDLAGGEPAVRALLDGLTCFSLAESLGGVESLIDHPTTMTHASMTPAARELAGIGDGCIRLSVGIEDVEDLTADLSRGLDRAAAVG